MQPGTKRGSASIASGCAEAQALVTKWSDRSDPKRGALCPLAFEAAKLNNPNAAELRQLDLITDKGFWAALTIRNPVRAQLEVEPLDRLAPGNKGAPVTIRGYDMVLLRYAPIALLALGACDEAAFSDDPAVRAEFAGVRSCIRAVQSETGSTGATHNTELPVVEVNQYIIDVPNQRSWTCYTNDQNRAIELVRLRGAGV